MPVFVSSAEVFSIFKNYCDAESNAEALHIRFLFFFDDSINMEQAVTIILVFVFLKETEFVWEEFIENSRSCGFLVYTKRFKLFVHFLFQVAKKPL